MANSTAVRRLQHYAGGNFIYPDPPAAAKIDTCVHCGLCLNVCPTYQELGYEPDSPRGRVYLIKAVAEGRMEIGPTFEEHIYNCLDCRACETACPSGVPVGSLIEEARGQIEAARARSGLGGFLRRLFYRSIFPYPGRVRLLNRVGYLAQRSGLLGWLRRRRFFGLLPAHLAQMEAVLPPFSPRCSSETLPLELPPVGERRARVGLLTGCIMDALFADVNWSTARVLQANGCEVVVPRAQNCCGALAVHGGERATAKLQAKRNIDAFEAARVDAIIVNAAGCGAALKEYGELLADDPEYHARADAFAANVRDVSEFLAELGPRRPEHPVEATVAYHDACHLAHGQRVRAQPRQLLRLIPGLRLVELPESDRCCGSAGVYNITHPDMAQRLLDRKVDNVPAAADVVATGNPGCILQIRLGARQRGRPFDVLHPVTLLDRAYHGSAAGPGGPEAPRPAGGGGSA